MPTEYPIQDGCGSGVCLRPSVKNLAHSTVAFLQDYDYARSLNEFVGKRQQAKKGNTAGLALCGGITGPGILHMALSDLRGLGPDGRFRRFEVGKDAECVFGEGTDVVAGNAESIDVRPEEAGHFIERRGLYLPESGKVGLAIGGARQRTGEIRLTVARARNPGRGIVQPLRWGAGRKDREQDEQSPISHVQSTRYQCYFGRWRRSKEIVNRSRGASDRVALQDQRYGWRQDPRNEAARELSQEHERWSAEGFDRARFTQASEWPGMRYTSTTVSCRTLAAPRL